MFQLNNLDEIDADLNHFNTLFPDYTNTHCSEYYNVSKLNSQSSLNNGDLALYHLNACFFQKFDSICADLSLCICALLYFTFFAHNG